MRDFRNIIENIEKNNKLYKIDLKYQDIPNKITQNIRKLKDTNNYYEFDNLFGIIYNDIKLLENYYNEIHNIKKSIDDKIKEEEEKIRKKEKEKLEKIESERKEREKILKEEEESIKKFYEEQKKEFNDIDTTFSIDEFNRLSSNLKDSLSTSDKKSPLYIYYKKLEDEYNDLIEDAFPSNLDFFYFQLMKNIKDLKEEYNKENKEENYYKIFFNYYFWKLLNNVKDDHWSSLVKKKMDKMSRDNEIFNNLKDRYINDLIGNDKIQFEENEARLYNKLRLRKNKLQDFIYKKRGIDNYKNIEKEIDEHIKDANNLFNLFSKDIKNEKKLKLDKIIAEDILDINERLHTKLNIRKKQLNDIISKKRGINDEENKELLLIKKKEEILDENTLNAIKLLKNEMYRNNFNLYNEYILSKNELDDKNLINIEIEKTLKEIDKLERRKNKIKDFIFKKRDIKKDIEKQFLDDNLKIFKCLNNLDDESKLIAIEIRDDISLILVKQISFDQKIHLIMQLLLSYLSENDKYDKKKIFDEFIKVFSYDKINNDNYISLVGNLNELLKNKKIFNIKK